MSGPSDRDRAGDELALSGDESLPWLESGDEEDEQGVDTGRIIGFALLGLIALALLLGAIWWLSNRGSQPTLTADGSTIEAPEGPYKVKPENAGGKEYAGTGNVAPAVGEGKTRDGRLAGQETPAPQPSIATRKTSEQIDAEGKLQPIAPEPSSYGVQVGAYSSRADAEQGWATLQRQTDKLNGVGHRIVQGQADIGTVFRLQAVAGDRASARALCEALKDDGVSCQVKR